MSTLAAARRLGAKCWDFRSLLCTPGSRCRNSETRNEKQTTRRTPKAANPKPKITPSLPAEGRAARIRSAAQNTTERMQAEEALRHNPRSSPCLSRAAQSVQRARTPDQVYRAVAGRSKRWLQLDDLYAQQRPPAPDITYTTFPAGLLRAAEKLTRVSMQSYQVPILPESVFGASLPQKEQSLSIGQVMRPPKCFPKPCVRWLGNWYL